MVCHLIELLDAFDMCANDSFLFFKHTDGAVNLYVAELFVIEVTKSGGHLVLAFVVEEHIEGPCVVVDFKLGTHWFFYAAK